MDLTSALDPNIAALLGNGGGNSQFLKMLMQSINPNAASDLQGQIGPPDLGPLQNLEGAAPPTSSGYVQPALAGPQTMQALGFGMAAAAGKPGATGLSALGEGGRDLLQQGASASDRSLRQAQIENEAALQEWSGKSKIADEVLGAQLKGPELEKSMLDLTGQTLARDEANRDSAAYRAGLLQNGAARVGVQQQNADTAGTRAGISQQRADTYDTKVTGDQDLKAQQLAQQQAKIDQAATQFQQKLMQESAAQGARIGLSAAQAAATEFKNQMTLRKNPITGELPDEGTQQALQQALAAKYKAAATAPATQSASPAGGQAKPGTGSLSATNPKTGQRIFSADGGTTWVDENGNAVGS